MLWTPSRTGTTGEKMWAVPTFDFSVPITAGSSTKRRRVILYGYAHRGYKSLVKVLKAVNNKTAEAQDDFKLDGQNVGAMHRHGKVSIVTLHTEDKK